MNFTKLCFSFALLAVWTLALSPGAAQEADTPAGEGMVEETIWPGEPSPTEGLPLDEVIGKLQGNYEKVDSYKAKFDQELFSVSQGKVVTRGAGEVMYKKPGRMVWRYTEPEEHLYVTDGETIWDYSPADKEAYLLKVEDALYKSFLLGLGEIREDFEVSFRAGRRMNSQGRYQLALVPKSRAERESLGTVTLYVSPDDFMVKETELVDALGNRNRIRFKDMEMNPEIADEVFEWKPPKGTKVIKAEQFLEGKDGG